MFLIAATLCFLAIFFIFGHTIKAKLSKQEKGLYQLQTENTHLQQTISELKHFYSHATEDKITSLLSWHFFEDRLQQNIKESERYQLTMAVLYVDIDDFNMINEALGTEAGNQLLYGVAKKLQSCIRQVDSISRISKDTFVIQVTQLSKPETAAIVAQRILQTLKSAITIGQEELYVTVGIGIAIYPHDGADAQALLGKAEHALYVAKKHGYHRYQFYEENLHRNSYQELTLNNNLKRETIFEEFVPYYQTIINAKDESVFALDAFVYWQHPELGLISSESVMMHAEKLNKLNIISEWLLTAACKQFLRWQAVGFAPQCLGISVGIKQLENKHFICRISQVMQELSFKPEWLLLEIKDVDTNIEAFEGIEKAFNMLQYLGVKIAITDFGATATSLQYIKKLSVDFLKLDPTLIEDIETNPRTLVLVKSLLPLCNDMGANLIVQGVATPLQMKMLTEAGCTLLQGPIISIPQAEAAVSNKIL